MLCFSFVEASTKSVPFSDLMTLTVPLVTNNRLSERAKEYMHKSAAVWIWTALVDRHVNKTM